MLDLDGTYVGTGNEHVVSPADLGIGSRELHQRAVLLDPSALVRWAEPLLLRHVLASAPTVLAVRAGVIFLEDPAYLTGVAASDATCLISRCSEVLPNDGLWPSQSDLQDAGCYSPELIAVSREASAFVDLWEHLAADPWTSSDRWLEVAVSHLPHRALASARLLVSPWTGPSAQISTGVDGKLEADGTAVLAVDLSRLNPDSPWLFDAGAEGSPRVRLSAIRGLALLAEQHAADARRSKASSEGFGPLTHTTVGARIHPQLRDVFRTAFDANSSQSMADLPDLFDPDCTAEATDWLVQPATDGSDFGIGRYLASVYRARSDLQWRFPGVPGVHVHPLLEWADKHGRLEDAYSSTLIDLTLQALGYRPGARVPRTVARSRPGVNVVGHLRAELGVGESARLMIDALAAGDIPHATASVDKHVQSRQGATFSASSSTAPFDTTLLCVNADMTATVSATIPALLSRSYRIGMWYWEVEDFPIAQHDAFNYVDEVWVATDFIRKAIEPHSPVPVRTITPPLPKPTTSARTRTQIGLPERPYFLFSFDFLSTAERKNPWGLVDAFEEAFAPDEGPLLVIKSINADRRPSDAERLRLRVAGRPDIILLEDYLGAEDRDALVGLCTCYVSLHRAEGLGLTMAEAMALGKPVIATGYSGNLEFMTEANSFLVPWNPTAIPTGCEPYPPGGTWAEPDTTAAAALMRTVYTDPELAQERGRQAAEDIRRLHSPEVTARQIAARLHELRPARRARRRAVARDELLAMARRAIRR